MVTILCAECETPFQVYPRTLRRVKNPTCSYHCNGMRRGREWVKHGHKGRAAWTDKSRASFHEKMSGSLNPAWQGGMTLKRPKGNYKGVKYVRCPVEFLPMARKDGYIMEHRLVMAQWVGRMLSRVEVVHHRNHNPADNQRENLELWPTNADHRRSEAGRFVDGVANLCSHLMAAV
jgi:hypothetical protein